MVDLHPGFVQPGVEERSGYLLSAPLRRDSESPIASWLRAFPQELGSSLEGIHLDVAYLLESLLTSGIRLGDVEALR